MYTKLLASRPVQVKPIERDYVEVVRNFKRHIHVKHEAWTYTRTQHIHTTRTYIARPQFPKNQRCQISSDQLALRCHWLLHFIYVWKNISEKRNRCQEVISSMRNTSVCARLSGNACAPYPLSIISFFSHVRVSRRHLPFRCAQFIFIFCFLRFNRIRCYRLLAPRLFLSQLFVTFSVPSLSKQGELWVFCVHKPDTNCSAKREKRKFRITLRKIKMKYSTCRLNI